jgi:hypothetical protein
LNQQQPYQVLTPGEIVTIRPEIRKYIQEVFPYARFNLKIGLALQHEHTQRKMDAGHTVEIFNDNYPLDRLCNGVREDDKCALIKEGVLAASHTIGVGEYPEWLKYLAFGKDTFINSFVQVHESQPFSFMFMGTYSFSKLTVIPSTYDGSFYFKRQQGFVS